MVVSACELNFFYLFNVHWFVPQVNLTQNSSIKKQLQTGGGEWDRGTLDELDVLTEPWSINPQSRLSADMEDMARIPSSFFPEPEKLLFTRSTTVATVKGHGKVEGDAAVKGTWE